MTHAQISAAAAARRMARKAKGCGCATRRRLGEATIKVQEYKRGTWRRILFTIVCFYIRSWSRSWCGSSSRKPEDLILPAMERVNAKFHTCQEGQRREGDIIWRIPTPNGGAIYLYILLELQSVVDGWMVVRVLAYVGLL